MTRFTICIFAALQLFMLKTLAQKNPITIQWKIAGQLPAANAQAEGLGMSGSIAGIHHNMLLVAGGSNFPDSMPWLGGKKKYYDMGYVFKKKDDDLKNYRSFRLPFAIAYAASCTTPQGILSAGGENENGISNKVLLIQWDPGKNSVIINKLPDLPFAVTNASVTANGNKIYLAGGETINTVSDKFLILDLKNLAAGWKILPSLPKAVSHSVMAMQSGGDHNSIYVIGGRKRNAGSTSELYSSTFQFDLRTNKWSEKRSLPYNLSAGTGIAYGNRHILLFGGDKGEVFHRTEELIAAINEEKDEIKKKQLNKQKIFVQSSHPGFSNEVLMYNTVTDKWTKSGNIPFENPVTTVACKWGSNIIIPGGEIKAGVRTPHILLGKISVK